MSSTNGNDPSAPLRAEEATLTRILTAKMVRQNCFGPGDQESVAYRISEIMVAAKELYTKDLPRLMQEDDQGEMFSDLAGLRMTFIHLRDLITDFDEAFLDAMTHLREGDGEDADESEDEDEDEGEDEEQEDEAPPP